MANFNLDLDNYANDHLVLWTTLTKVSAAGYRYCDTTSQLEHTVTVKSGNTSCVLYLRQRDFYIVGFKGGDNKVYAFQDNAPTVFNTKLSMASHYAKLGGKSTTIDRTALDNAIVAFGGHTGTSWNGLDAPLLALILLVSESLRFRDIQERMRQVTKSKGATTTFNAWYSTVTNWESSTDDLHDMPKLMNKPSKYNVKTWHHFQR